MARMVPLALTLMLVWGCTEQGYQPTAKDLEVIDFTFCTACWLAASLMNRELPISRE